MNIRPARTEDAAGVARVHVDTWRTTYPGLVPAEYLASLSHEAGRVWWEKLIAALPAGQFCLVAEDPDRGIVGFASGGPARQAAPATQPGPADGGEIHALYVLKDYQGRGIGRALVEEAARLLLEQGRGSLVVWVLAENPNRAFYETLGGEVSGRQNLEIGGAKVEEVAYLWRDAAVLSRRRTG